MSARIERVGIIAKRGLAASDHLSRLAAWLRERRIEAIFESETAMLAGAAANGSRAMTREQLPLAADLAIVLGGDGTLLAMAARIAAAGRDIPILGVNFGSLGFLTEIRIDELYNSLERVLDGTADFDERAVLTADTHRGNTHFDSCTVLNDVVFTKGPLSRMIELSVSVSGGFMTRVKADCLIVATATGSTAYNLSAGGPIVHPAVDALVLTPIAPHTLTQRPIVIPGGSVVEVAPLIDEETFVTYDGQSGYPLKPGDVVRVRKSERRLRLVKAPARSYFELLREKLKWGER